MDNTPTVGPIVVEDEEPPITKHQKYGNLLDYFRPKLTSGVIEYKAIEPEKK
jgi:hypothetical protein